MTPSPGLGQERPPQMLTLGDNPSSSPCRPEWGRMSGMPPFQGGHPAARPLADTPEAPEPTRLCLQGTRDSVSDGGCFLAEPGRGSCGPEAVDGVPASSWWAVVLGLQGSSLISLLPCETRLCPQQSGCRRPHLTRSLSFFVSLLEWATCDLRPACLPSPLHGQGRRWACSLDDDEQGGVW